MNLTNLSTGDSYGNARILIANTNAPDGVPRFITGSNMVGTSRASDPNPSNQASYGDLRRMPNRLIANNRNPGNGNLLNRSVTGNIDGVNLSSNGVFRDANGNRIQTTREEYSISRRNALTASFNRNVANFSAGGARTANTQSQDVSDWLTIFPNLNVTLTGNSTSNAANTTLVTGTTTTFGGLKLGRATAFGNIITGLNIAPARVNQRASPGGPGSATSRNVTITYN